MPFCRLVIVGLALAGLAPAAEYAVLSTGFTLRVDRHEVEGDKVRLFANGGVTEMPAALIVEFQPAAELPHAVSAGTAPAEIPPPDPKKLVEEAAKKYGLPPALLHSLARAESGYDPKALSSKGAIGIMQLMPDTARELGADPHDPAENVDAGTRYLRDLLLKYAQDDYQVRKALAAYNAGPGAVQKYQGVPPYRETINYVERVIRQSGIRKPEAKSDLE